MEVVGFLALAATVVKIVSVIKAIGKDNNLVITQVVVWAVGMFVLWIAGAADITSSIEVPGLEGTTVGDYEAADIIMAGFLLGSSGAFGYDALTKRKVNEPPLLGTRVP